jgi:hypothetical protein
MKINVEIDPLVQIIFREEENVFLLMNTVVPLLVPLMLMPIKKLKWAGLLEANLKNG